MIVAATNNPGLLDHALFRRFEDVLHYALPEDEERQILIRNILGTFIGSRLAWKSILAESQGLSHAEIDQANEILALQDNGPAYEILLVSHKKGPVPMSSGLAGILPWMPAPSRTTLSFREVLAPGCCLKMNNC